ncbi:MAG: DUF1292 domain-containing protein [Bacilli bacterium]|nr:DUF1292 domain-containing protein [Bacilli bacterium]
MKKSAIDMLFDQVCRENITGENMNGEAVEFEQIALIPYNEMLFAILVEVKTQEVCVYMYDTDEDGEVLVLIDDDELIDEIVEEYYRLCA